MKTSGVIAFCALCASCALFSTRAAAQVVFRTFDGTRPGMRLGSAFDAVGDVNGDGITDIVAGDPGDDTAGPDAGRAQLLSGADGAVIFTWFGSHAGDRLGESVSDAGDVDADGIPDALVGSTTDNFGAGAACVYSGADGSPLHHVRGLAVGDEFAFSMDRAGDLDGDGHGDFLIGAPGVDAGAANNGAVYAYRGSDGSLLHVVAGQAHPDMRYGTFVSWVGDVDADGSDDLFAGTPEIAFTWPAIVGYAEIRSGTTGERLRYMEGLDSGHGFWEYGGQGLLGAGDVDGDGYADYGHGLFCTAFGSMFRIYSGTDHTLIREIPVGGNDLALAGPFANVGDANGDGVPDLLATGELGVLNLHSGATGELLQALSMPAGMDATSQVHGLGDLDLDGVDDYGIGAPLADAAGPDAGRLLAYSGNPCGPPTRYCTTSPNSVGAGGVLQYAGSSSVGSNTFELRAIGLPPGQFGLFFYGLNPTSAPLGDGVRCIGFTYHRLPAFAIDAAGTGRWPLDLTAPPVPAAQITVGSVWNFQAWYRDPAAGGAGHNLTDALAFTFCE